MILESLPTANLGRSFLLLFRLLHSPAAAVARVVELSSGPV